MARTRSARLRTENSPALKPLKLLVVARMSRSFFATGARAFIPTNALAPELLGDLFL